MTLTALECRINVLIALFIADIWQRLQHTCSFGLAYKKTERIDLPTGCVEKCRTEHVCGTPYTMLLQMSVMMVGTWVAVAHRLLVLDVVRVRMRRRVVRCVVVGLHSAIINALVVTDVRHTSHHSHHCWKSEELLDIYVVDCTSGPSYFRQLFLFKIVLVSQCL